jgi:hypothetical protein
LACNRPRLQPTSAATDLGCNLLKFGSVKLTGCDQALLLPSEPSRFDAEHRENLHGAIMKSTLCEGDGCGGQEPQ